MTLKQFERQRQKLAASPTCAASCRSSAEDRLAALKRFDKKNDNPGCFSGVAIKRRKFRSKVHQPKLMLQPNYCAVITATVVACAMIGAPTSSGFRRITCPGCVDSSPILPRQRIDSARIAQ